MTPDVNVLVAALREDHPQHARARQWLAEALERCLSGATLALLPMVAVGFVRVVTNNRLPRPVTPTIDALSFLRAILDSPGVWMPDVGLEWPLLEAQCLRLGLRGGIISDAWIAAAVSANGLHLVTFDAEFRRLLRPDQCTFLEPWPPLQEQCAIYTFRRAA
jgi:hypothetical protein